jgi:hypothetical protein
MQPSQQPRLHRLITPQLLGHLNLVVPEGHAADAQSGRQRHDRSPLATRIL